MEWKCKKHKSNEGYINEEGIWVCWICDNEPDKKLLKESDAEPDIILSLPFRLNSIIRFNENCILQSLANNIARVSGMEQYSNINGVDISFELASPIYDDSVSRNISSVRLTFLFPYEDLLEYWGMEVIEF